MSGTDKQGQIKDKSARSIGADAENLAVQYLEQKGLTLLTRNYHCRQGEIDIIMRDGNFLVFLEVRYRKNNHYGSAAESVTRQKQRRLLITADYYLQNERCNADTACRFDVITLSGPQKPQIAWIKDAFQAHAY